MILMETIDKVTSFINVIFFTYLTQIQKVIIMKTKSIYHQNSAHE